MPSFETGAEVPSSPPSEPASATPVSGSSILFGPLGLRAGWGILLYVAFALLLGFALFYAVAEGTGKLPQIQAEMAAAHAAAAQSLATGTPVASHPQRVSLGMVSEVSETAAVLLAGLGLSYLERRRFAVYGLQGRGMWNLFPGAFWGLAAISVLVGSLRAAHLLVFDAQLLHGRAIAAYGIAWLAFFLLVGVFEEFLFRGYIQFTQMRGFLGLAERFAPSRGRSVAFWMSAVLWSGIFFISHLGNSGENPAGLLGVFLAGILFSYALWRTGSLWWGIGFHMTWDWGQSFLFGVPDSGILSAGRLFATHAAGKTPVSGGIDGPEGSILLIPVLLMVFIVLRVHKAADQPPVEPERALAGSSEGHRLESESA